MKLLLDTHTLLWFLADDARLSTAAKRAIEDIGNERWLSPISLLEIAVKVRLGKLTLDRSFAELFPHQLESNDIGLLKIEARHVAPLADLPLHHRDPFDRLLIATSLTDLLTLVSADQAFDSYGITRLW